MASISKPIDQLAFNVSLVAYDYGISSTDLQIGRRLGFRDIKRNKKLADLKDGDYTIPPVKPTHQELSIDQTETVGIWVGMLPSTAQTEHIRDLASNTRFKGKSINALALKSGFSKLDTDPKALRVVVPMYKETASYYALVDQDVNGLCSGINILITEVFFFPEFRKDELTDTAKRKSEWSEMVRRVSNPVEKISFAKNYDKTKFQVSPKRSLASELSSFVGTYIEGGDSSVLKSAIELIDQADTEGAFTPPPPNNKALAKLAQSTTKMSDVDCSAALSELLMLAPELEIYGISAQDIQQINTGLVETKTTLPYGHLRAFIVQFLAAASARQLDLNNTVLDCAAHVRLQLGGKPTFLERQGELEGLNLILDGQKKKMHDFMGYIRSSITALKNSQGDSVVATAPTLPQIWTKYSLSPDLDSAKLYASGVHRHNVEALCTILEPLTEMLLENCKHLEMLKLSVPVDESEEGMGGGGDTEMGGGGGDTEMGGGGDEEMGGGGDEDDQEKEAEEEV